MGAISPLLAKEVFQGSLSPAELLLSFFGGGGGKIY